MRFAIFDVKGGVGNVLGRNESSEVPTKTRGNPGVRGEIAYYVW